MLSIRGTQGWTTMSQQSEPFDCGLSAREREVMLLIVEGSSSREIACQLKMSESTVKTHLHSIYEKLAINNRTTLAGRSSR